MLRSLPNLPRRALAAACFTVVLCLAVPAGAWAAAPFVAGQGGPPRIAVAPDGRGHVAWGIPARPGQPAKIGYCRIPAGADACDVKTTLDFPASGDVPASDPSDVSITVSSESRLVITSSCTACAGAGAGGDRVYAFASSDGGNSFAAPTFLGTTATAAGIQEGGVWLDGQSLFVTPGEGISALIGGSGAAVLPGVPVVSGGFVYGTSIVPFPGSSKLIYAANDLGRIQYAVFTGAPTAADLSNPVKWLGQRVLASPEPDSTGTGLTTGPGGVWLFYQRSAPGQTQVLLRQFDPGSDTFGQVSSIASADPIDVSTEAPDVSADPTGRLHAVWRSPFDTGRLRYTRSGTDGAGFAAVLNLARAEDFQDPAVAAGADQNGWAAWHGSGDSPVLVVRIDPLAEGAESQSGQPVFKGPESTTTVSVPGASIDFGVPRACVQPGATFKVTLKWKRKKQKGNLFVKVTRADFYIGATVVKVDRTAPFVQTLKVTAGAKRGSTITLRARAFIKVKRGKAPKKSIRSKIKVCAT